MQSQVSRYTAGPLQVLALLASLSLLPLGGCERKEKVLDIETPEGEIEVERSLDDGDVDVKINEK
jgi:hypothetical protein